MRFREGLERLRESGLALRRDCATCPAVPASLVFVLGILAGFALHQGQLALAVLAGVAAVTVPALVTPWRAWRILLLPFGAAWMVLHLAAPWDRLDEHVPARASRATVRGIVADPHAAGPALDLVPAPYSMVVRVTHLRKPGQRTFRRVRSKALVLLPPNCRVVYGDRVEIRGAFIPQASPVFAGGFDYAWYLRTKGIRHIIQARAVEITGGAAGWRRLVRSVLDGRDRLAVHLVKDIPTPENAAILLAMTFGFRRHLPPTTQRRYLRSGAIHVFAVSGLHVGIVAFLFSSGLRLARMPHRQRHLAVPLLLGLYVVMTGAAPSSVRAWLMVSLTCLSLWRDRKLNPVNIVAVAAIILLVINPLSLFQTGFVFSFTIVSVLILGWSGISHLGAVLCERDLWIPRRLRRRWRRGFIRRSSRAIGASLLAWFGSAGLVAYANGLVVPGAILVNLVLSVVAYFTIAIAMPKALLSAIGVPGVGVCLGAVLEQLLDLLHMLVQAGSQFPASVSVRPPHWTAVLGYYAMVAGVLAPWLSRKVRLLLGAGAAVWVLSVSLMPRTALTVAVLHGNDCDSPVVLMERDNNRPPLLIHSGTYALHRDLMGWMQARGYRDVDLLVVPWTAGRGDWATPISVDLLNVNSLLVPEQATRRGAVGTAVRQQQSQGGRVRPAIEHAADVQQVAAGGVRVRVSERSNARCLQLTDWSRRGPVQLELQTLTSGRHRICVAQQGATPQTLDILPTLHRRLVTIPLARPGRKGLAAQLPAALP